jgi:hypothetical protein
MANVTSNPVMTGISSLTGVYTLATLPSASVMGAGFSAFITDATTPVFLSLAVGGGAVFSRVFSDGTNWRIG